MQRLWTSAVVAALLIACLAFGVRAGADDDEDDDRGKMTYQTANAMMFPGGGAVAGAATLFRDRNSAWLHLATSGLDQNAAYTVWWILFNNPEACVGGCGADDIPRPGVRASVLYAAGFVTGMDGTANVTAHLNAGKPPEGLEVRRGMGLRKGRGLAAEIHLIIRSHGPTIPGMAATQIGSFEDGCGVCDDQQSVVFMPTM